MRSTWQHDDFVSYKLGRLFEFSSRGLIYNITLVSLLITVTSLLLFAPHMAFAKDTSAAEALRAVENKYQTAMSVKMDVKKTLRLSVLDKTKESHGEMTLQSPGHMRLELKEPDNSLLVVNPKSVWLVHHPLDDDFDDKVRVTVSKEPLKSQPQMLVVFLMGSGSLLDTFTIKNEATWKPGGEPIELEPKKKTESEISKASLIIEAGEIKKLSYFDHLDNETVLEFSKTKFGEKIKKTLFEYKPPKDAVVTRVD
ncbi:MAG: hypothetical protein COT74_04610 [Bdellovibrionales bacterium CG10_big_fil_rev_8_21_14_0_10_45_34]|nr:MAG: hypothetical protein COT74_04610 [Bdellovibrionales bacterium CG10_big_fil_rev_8_21_14_0_10_45_34]